MEIGRGLWPKRHAEAIGWGGGKRLFLTRERVLDVAPRKGLHTSDPAAGVAQW